MDETTRHYYETTMSEWLAVEAIVRQRDKEKTAHAVAKLSSESSEHNRAKTLDNDVEIENDVFEENAFSDLSDPEVFDEEESKVAAPNEKPNRLNKSSTDSGNVPDDEGETKDSEEMAEAKDIDDGAENESSATEETPPTERAIAEASADGHGEDNDENIDSNKSSPSESSYETVANDFTDLADQMAADFGEAGDEEAASPTTKRHAVIITDASVDIVNLQNESPSNGAAGDGGADTLSPLQEEASAHTSLDALQEPKSACVSPASSNGGIYSVIHIDFHCQKPHFSQFVHLISG